MRPFEIPEVKRGERPNAEKQNMLIGAARYAANIRFDRYFRMRDEGSGRALVSIAVEAVRGFVWRWIMTRMAFGYKINQGAGTVTIYSGRVAVLGDSDKVAETNVTIPTATKAAPVYVYVEITPNNIANSSIANMATSVYPLSSHNYYVRCLYAFSKVDDVIRLVTVHHLGDIYADDRR